MDKIDRFLKNTYSLINKMSLIELTEDDENFFLDGEIQGFVCSENGNALVLNSPISLAIEGSAMRKFYLADEPPTLYIQYQNSVTDNLVPLKLGKVSDVGKAEKWIERVNKLYE